MWFALGFICGLLFGVIGVFTLMVRHD